MHAELSTEHVPPWIGQYEGSEHVVTKSAWQIGKYGVELHASPVAEQVWPVLGQLASAVHEAPEVLQWPAMVGQLPSAVQAVVVDTEHVPGTIGLSDGSEPAMWHTAAVLTLQWPALPQLASTVHVLPSVEQVAPTTVQSASVEHAPLDRLHLPLRTQAASPKQGALSRLHRPGCVGHSAGLEPAV